MSSKYNKTVKSTYYKSSKKEHMKTEYMIIPNPKYASGQECLSLTFSEEMIQEYLDNLTADQLIGPSDFGNRKFAFAIDDLHLDMLKNYSPIDFVVYPAEFLANRTRLETPSGMQIPENKVAEYIVVVNGFDTFACVAYDKFIASIFYKAQSLGGVVSDENGYILTTKGHRIKQTANRMAGQSQ